MVLGSFFFKHRARIALKGNWQNALVVTFFASVLVTIAQVLQSVVTQDINGIVSSLSYALQSMPEGVSAESTQFHEVLDLYQRLFSAIGSITQSTWIGLLVVNIVALVVTPVLSVSCNHYFIRLRDGEEIGVIRGLTERLNLFLRALWLHVIMFVKIFLWSLLLVIPGIIAAIRYSMAPYYLAEHPEMKAREAIRKSKETMKHLKMSYFMLQLSFIGWNLLVSLVQLWLTGISPMIALVAAQFLSLMVSTYLSASNAVFYCAATREGGMEKLVADARRHARQMGMDDSAFDHVQQNDDDETLDGGDEE